MKIKLALSYKIYFWLNRHREWYIQEGHVRCRVLKLAVRFYKWFDGFLSQDLIDFYEKHPVSIVPVREQNVVVSLTSFPARIDTTWIAIESIFHQSVKPDRIILWLAESQFPNKINEIPQKLLDLQKRGLEIRFCEDLRSHKKYYNVMLGNNKDIVVLVDDDIIYPIDTISKLLRYYKKYPECVIAISTYMPQPGLREVPSLWTDDNSRKAMRPQVLNQVFSGAGSLWPPRSIDDRAFDKKKISELAPYADDLWLYVMMLLKRKKACRCKRYSQFPHEVIGSQTESLFSINGIHGENQNNIQWEKLIKTYGDELESIYPNEY